MLSVLTMCPLGIWALVPSVSSLLLSRCLRNQLRRCQQLSEPCSDTVSATLVQIMYVFLLCLAIRHCSIIFDTLRYSLHFSTPDFSYFVDTLDLLGLWFGLR